SLPTRRSSDLDADNYDDTVLSFIRHGKRKKDFLIVILNFTPVERRNFRIGVPYEGTYTEILNTEMKEFGGTWVEHNADSVSEEVNFKDYEESRWGEHTSELQSRFDLVL